MTLQTALWAPLPEVSVYQQLPPSSNLPPEAALQEGVWASLLAPSHLEQTPAC